MVFWELSTSLSKNQTEGKQNDQTYIKCIPGTWGLLPQQTESRHITNLKRGDAVQRTTHPDNGSDQISNQTYTSLKSFDENWWTYGHIDLHRNVVKLNAPLRKDRALKKQNTVYNDLIHAVMQS